MSEAVVVTTADCVFVLLCNSAFVFDAFDAKVVMSNPVAMAAIDISVSSAKPVIFLSIFTHLLNIVTSTSMALY